jgi:CrcB protein
MQKFFLLSLLVACGGFFGAAARYGLAELSRKLIENWPLGTLAANFTGCLILGILTALADKGRISSPELRLALATGFCGGFTTMSSFIYEISEFFKDSEYLKGLLYLTGTIFICIGAFAVGMIIIRIISRSGGGI